MFIALKVEVFNMEDDLRANCFEGCVFVVWDCELLK
jgi:hypothetical protein